MTMAILGKGATREEAVAIADAGKQVVKTDIPKQMLSYFVQLGSKAKDQPVQTLELTLDGAGIDTDKPTPEAYAHVRELIQQALYPPSPTPTPEG